MERAKVLRPEGRLRVSRTLDPPRRPRCAVYTRKSSEEGLEQAFNSLDAQREACAAYVASQKSEGWVLLNTVYDDGGFSGGSMERPALKRLMADVDAGMVDVVVVYKVDRLTRSLADFAKIVEVFDARSASFVSVTQAFNTTTSMGRLTLNVLLSFAQFEREVTGERIRDKLAASKKKGMWMGGLPPLGYAPPTDLTTRALVVVPEEAEVVCSIFRRYLELGSVDPLRRELEDQGVRSKTWVTRIGRALGGLPFNRGALYHLLKNRIYVGEIVHGDASYPGAHDAIVDAVTFAAVQVKLEGQAMRKRAKNGTRVTAMPLTGLIYDHQGRPMTPTFTHKPSGKVYRYYVSAPVHQGHRSGDSEDDLCRLSAKPTEQLVADALAHLGHPPGKPLADILQRVEVHSTTLQLLIRRRALFPRGGDAEAEQEVLAKRLPPGVRLSPEQLGGEMLYRITLPGRPKPWRGEARISEAAVAAGTLRPRPGRAARERAAHRPRHRRSTWRRRHRPTRTPGSKGYPRLPLRAEAPEARLPIPHATGRHHDWPPAPNPHSRPASEGGGPTLMEYPEPEVWRPPAKGLARGVTGTSTSPRAA